MTVINGEDGLKGVELRYESLRKLQDELGPYLAGEGFFLKGEVGLAPSDVLRFKIMLPGDFVLVEGVGIVIWVRSREESGPQDPPGTALGFATLSEQGRELIERMVQTHQENGGHPFDLTRPTSIHESPEEEEKEEPKSEVKYNFSVRGESESTKSRTSDSQVAEVSAREESSVPATPELPFPEESPGSKLEQEAEDEEPTSSMDAPELEISGIGLGEKPEIIEDLESLEQELPEIPEADDDLSDSEVPREERQSPGPKGISPEGFEAVDEDVPDESWSESEAENDTRPETGEEVKIPSPLEGSEGEFKGEEEAPLTSESEKAHDPWKEFLTPNALENVTISSEDDNGDDNGVDEILRVPTSPDLDVVISDDGSMEVSSSKKSSGALRKALFLVVFLGVLGCGAWWVQQNYSEEILNFFEGRSSGNTADPGEGSASEEGSVAVSASGETAPDDAASETGSPQAEAGDEGGESSKKEPDVPPVEVKTPAEVVPSPVPTATPPTAGKKVPIHAAGRVLDVSFKAEKDGTRVRIRTDGRIDAHRLRGGPLPVPPRYLLRIDGIRSPFRPLEISAKTTELRKIRFGYHEETRPRSLWIVFDLEDSSIKLLKREVRNEYVEILLGR